MIKVTKKCKIIPRELKIGTKIELEHTTSRKKTAYIAKQHLCEHPRYYTKGLLPMERKLKRIPKR